MPGRCHENRLTPPPRWFVSAYATACIGIEPREARPRARHHLSAIQKYESGANRISAGRLQQIGRLFGVEISFFFQGSPAEDIASDREGDNVAEISAFMATVEGVRLASAMMKIKNARTRRRIIELVEAAAERS